MERSSGQSVKGGIAAVDIPDPDNPVMHDFPIANASITELIHWPQGRLDGGAPRYTEFVSIGSVAHLPVASHSEN